MSPKSIIISVASVCIVVFGAAARRSIVFTAYANLAVVIVPIGIILVAGIIAIALIRRALRQKSLRDMHGTWRTVYVLTMLSAPYILGTYFREQDLVDGRQYFRELALSLEDYKRQHGVYPENLDPIRNKGSLPFVLQGKSFYRPVKGTYVLKLSDPIPGMFGVQLITFTPECREDLDCYIQNLEKFQ